MRLTAAPRALRAPALVLAIAIASPVAAQPLVPLTDGAEALASIGGRGGGGGCSPSSAPPRLTLANVAPAEAGAPWQTRVPDAAWPSLYLASETVASYLRGRLGAKDGQLPLLPDSAFNWRMLDGHVHVVAYRDGAVRWWLSSDVPGHASRQAWQSDAGERLIAAALDSAVRGGEAFTWPEGVDADSIPFALRFAWPLPTRDTLRYRPMNVRHAAPVAPLRVPSIVPPSVRKMARIRYPERAREARTRGLIRMRYVIDTTGRVDERTIEDMWDPKAPKLEGRRELYYLQLVKAARRGIANSEFEPAMIGTCTVPMRVEQEFQFMY